MHYRLFSHGGVSYRFNGKNGNIVLELVISHVRCDDGSKVLGPDFQSIVSLTTSLRRQFVKYMPATLSNRLLFFVEKNCGNLLQCKVSHIFPTKNNSVL